MRALEIRDSLCAAKQIRRVCGISAMVAALVTTALAGCGGEPTNVAGTYTVAITNGENGCSFEDWTTGDTATGIPLTVTQDGEAVTATVDGLVGVFLGLWLGSNQYEGVVGGSSLDLTLFGTLPKIKDSCSYTVNSVIDARLEGDILQGEIRYVANTNGSPECAMVEGCTTRQSFNGTRPPSAE